MPPKEPIFIVGVQRSGTTLLSAMLSAHSELSCGPETHFFRRLSKINPDQITEVENWPENAINFILSITHTNFKSKDRTSLIEKYKLSEKEIKNYLEDRPPSVSTILSSVTEQYMQNTGKQRWIEKTPDHILHLEMIRKYFPSSPIIRIVRDPRAVALSLKKVPWGAESFLHALLTWKKLDLASDAFFSTDPFCHTIYFEKLLESPRMELENLCNFLNENFEEQMLDTAYTGKQLNSRNVDWKAKASQPLDPSRIHAWQSELTPFEKTMAEAMIGDRIKFHGYNLEAKFKYVGEFFPGTVNVPKYQNKLGDLLGSDTRYWKEDFEIPTTIIFFGDPSADGWIRRSKLLGLWDSVSIAIQIILGRFKKKRIYWIPPETKDNWSGFNAFLLKKLLNPHRFHSLA